MNIVFRVDSAVHIGNGHLVRCLTLAKALRENGHLCYFLCRDLPGSLHEKVVEQGFSLNLLVSVGTEFCSTMPCEKWLGVQQQEDASECIDALSLLPPMDLLVTDCYALDAVWHGMLRKRASRLLVIDDLANRHYDCDLLLDQTYGRMPELYHYWTKSHTQLLLGTKFALLGREFSKLVPQARERRQKVGIARKILISMGGTDLDNITTRVLDSIEEVAAEFDLQVTVVLGANATHLQEVKSRLFESSISGQLLCGVDNMAELILEHDLAVGAAGTTSWERCCLGLPSIVLTTAENQLSIASQLSKVGAIEYLGEAKTNNIAQVGSLLQLWLREPERYRRFTEKSWSVCDGLGVDRVASMVEKCASLEDKCSRFDG